MKVLAVDDSAPDRSILYPSPEGPALFRSAESSIDRRLLMPQYGDSFQELP